MVMTNIYTQKFKVRGQVVQKLEWGPVDRWSETTDVLKPLVNDVGNYTVLQKKVYYPTFCDIFNIRFRFQ